MRAILYSYLIFLTSFYCVHASGLPQQKLESYLLKGASLEAAVQQLSDSIAPDSSPIFYAVLPSSVSYDLQVPSGHYDSLVEQLLGRGLQKVAQKEKDYQIENAKITLLLRGLTAREVASHLFEYFGCEYRMSGNTLIFQRNYVIRINQIEISEDLMTMIQEGKIVLPFPEDMFILVPHRNLILLASFDPIESQVREIRGMEAALKQTRAAKKEGKTLNPFDPPPDPEDVDSHGHHPHH